MEKIVKKDFNFMNSKNNLLRKHSNKIYPIPLVVLDLNNNSLTKASINLIMKIGISEKLEIELMEHIENFDKIKDTFVAKEVPHKPRPFVFR